MQKKPTRFERICARARALCAELPLNDLDEPARLHKFVHFWLLVWRSFVRNRCPVRASALAYGTLLALIPMLAVVMSITSGLLKNEGEEKIEKFIEKFVANVSGGAASESAAAPAQPDSELATPETSIPQAHNEHGAGTQKAVAKKIDGFIKNTRSGALGVTGSVLLIFAAISMLSRIEDTFNDIWGVARGRSWFMRVVLYWGVLSLAPILLVVALGLASGPHLESTKRWVATLPLVGSFILNFGFQIGPVALLCMGFGAFYMLMPNTRVQWRAAMVGGLIAGLLFHLNNMVSVLYVSRVVSNSKIYGSLGLVPVFMIGMYLSWLILLFGAQVAYAFQNRSTYFEEKQVENINQRGREFIALRIMTRVGQRYLQGAPPLAVADLAEELSVPTRLVRQLLQTLAAAQLVVETAGAEPAYLPARPMEQITCHDILQAMRATQGQELATRDEPSRAEVYGEFQRIQEAERQVAAGVTMLTLANRAQAHLLSDH